MTVKELRTLLKGVPGDTEIAVTGPYASQGGLLHVQARPSLSDRAWLGFIGNRTKVVVFCTDLMSG